MADGQAETLRYHHFLVAETKLRLERYAQAIARTVRPGDVVLDLGSGLGLLAVFACRAGARRVFAVEQDDVAELAMALWRHNGVHDRIICIKNSSMRVDLQEPADVLVTDTFGTFGLQTDGLRAILDARRRLLTRQARLIPRSVALSLALVECPAFYRDAVESWSGKLQGVDLSVLRPLAANNAYPIRLEQETFLGEPVCAADLPLAEVDRTDVHMDLTIEVSRPGMAHGLCGWFVARLTDDLELSNRPSQSNTNYAQIFFPLEHPSPVQRGEQVRVRLHSLDADEWAWQVQIGSQARMDQATAWGWPLSKEWLSRAADTHRPRLSSIGQAEAFLLSRFNGKRSLVDLAQELFKRYPDPFKSPQEAHDFVRELARRCS